MLITGGHPTPALAVIDEARASRLPVSFLFAGRRRVNPHEPAQSLEYQEVFARKIPFVNSNAQRGWRGIVRLPLSIIEAVLLLRHSRPSAVLSFGGYVGVPFCIAGYLHGIPVYLHEQTIRPGLANVHLARIARAVMISFPETRSFFPRSKVVQTGNPVRRALTAPGSGGSFDDLPGPVILVLGGNMGSHSINVHIFGILSQLLERYSVIHQIGNIGQYDDWERAQEHHLALPAHQRSRYVPIQHLATADIAQVYGMSTCIVCRSGASTVMELIALRKPAVLIPLPWSAFDEQAQHAKLLSQAGVAVTFDQSRESDELLASIQMIVDHVQSYISHYDALSHLYEPHAAKKILDTILKKSTEG